MFTRKFQTSVSSFLRICAAVCIVGVCADAYGQIPFPGGGKFPVPGGGSIPVPGGGGGIPVPPGVPNPWNNSGGPVPPGGGTVAIGPSYEDRVRELKNGYNLGADIVRIEPNFSDPAQAQSRANQLLRELTDPLANRPFQEVNHGIKVYSVRTGYSGISVPKWLAYARGKFPRPSGGGSTQNMNRSVFVTQCGARLERTTADNFVLRYDTGPTATFRSVGSTANQFRFAGNGEPPYGIHTLVIQGGYLGKVYRGQSQPIFHEGWNGQWVR